MCVCVCVCVGGLVVHVNKPLEPVEFGVFFLIKPLFTSVQH